MPIITHLYADRIFISKRVKELLLFWSIIAFVLLGGTMVVYAGKTENVPIIRTKYYTSIPIQAGDTLWSIAQIYRTDEYASIQEYINELKFINNLTGDLIQQGNNLTIAYYGYSVPN